MILLLSGGRFALASGSGDLFLRAIFGAALLASFHTGRIKNAADDMVTNAREVLDAASANQHDRVLLQVVAFSRNIRRDDDTVRKLYTSHLAQGRVRFLRGRSVDTRAHSPTLRASGKRGSCRLVLRRLSSIADELLCGGQKATPI